MAKQAGKKSAKIEQSVCTSKPGAKGAILLLGFSIGLLSGCSSGQSVQTPAEAPSKTPASATPMPSAPTTQPPQAVQGGFERGKLLSRVREQQQAQAQASSGPPPQEGGGDPWLSRYGNDRLYKASTIRSWAVIPVIPVGIDAFMKTAWAKGNLHIRLAMLGPLQNLQMFLRDHNNLRLTFTDQSGNNLKEMIVPCASMQQAPPSANGGAPTFQFESDIECPLEEYEQFYQWTFEWN